MSEKTLVGYFESWSENWASEPEKQSLSNIALYVNTVVVAFIKPDCSYSGNCNLKGTGLGFWSDNNDSDGTVVRNAIAILKKRNPNTKVLVSIGGANEEYNNFAQLNPTAIANIITDFGFDGVDIDYEHSNGTRREFSDLMRKVVSEIRQVLPRPYLVTFAAWSIGAYGEDDWIDAKPSNNKTGIMLDFLRSSEATMIDQLHVMSFNGGQIYNPQEALKAYQYYFKGRVVMGVQVPPEWNNNNYTLSKVRDLAQAVVDNDAAGIMIWTLQKEKDSDNSSDDMPSAEMIVKTACQVLSIGNCQQPLFGTAN
ncbi:glycoside hydrolase family 18 protein [Nostoc sp.]|uniref:glycoside hydrolase family 18 protein n=1 Tax=Nostoc sp. TaxID=1180 RepID=UPI002FF7EA83